MGRSGSSVARRLSKPRTKSTPSTPLECSDNATSSSSPPASNDMDYFGEHVTVISSRGDRRSNGRSRSRIRAYLYSQSRENSPSSSDNDEGSQSSLASAARGAKKRLSRTGSSIMQLSSAKASTNYLSCYSSSNVRLTEDSDASARLVDEIKEKAYFDTLAAEQHVSTRANDDQNPDTALAPMRRKSLYTPGLATRHPSDILRKPPPPQSIETQADRDYYYNPAYPECSPLSTLAALGLHEDGRSTPKSFAQLGGLKLGTLRVTNGASSPVKALDSESSPRPLSPTSTFPDDFQTASEGSEDEGRKTPTLRQRSGSASIVTDGSAERVSNVLTEAPLDGFSNSVRSSPPPAEKSLDLATDLANGYISEFGGGPYAATCDGAASVAPFVESDVNDEGISMPNSPKEYGGDWRAFASASYLPESCCQTRNDALARLNRNTSTHERPPDLECVPEKQRRPNACLGKAPSSDSGYSSNTSSIADHLTSPQTKLEVDVETRPRRSILRQRKTSIQERPIKAMPESASKFSQDGVSSTPQQAADTSTGYSSSEFVTKLVSIDSMDPNLPTRDGIRLPASNVMRKLRKSRPKWQPPPAEIITVQGSQDLSHAAIPRVPSVMAARHAERLSAFPALEHTFPSLNHTHLSRCPSSAKVLPVTIEYPSALDPGLGAITGLMDSQATLSKNSSPALTKPGQSEDIHAPTQANGVHKSLILAVDRKTKKLQKRTIKERRLAEKQADKEERQREWQVSKDRKDLRKRKSKGSSRKRSTSRSRRLSWSRTRSSSGQLDENGARTTISDFGTVTESIGGSPYDIAKGLNPSSTDRRTGHYPQQITTRGSRGRPSSFVGRTWSDSDQKPIDGQDQQQSACKVNFSRPGKAARPQSIYTASTGPSKVVADVQRFGPEWAHVCRNLPEDSYPLNEIIKDIEFNDRGGIPGKLPRPRSIAAEIPPLPALPSAREVSLIERKRAESRPQSLVMPTSRLSRLPTETPESTGKSLTTSDPDQPSTNGTHQAMNNHEVDSWEAYRRAWRQRRQSAGEALSGSNLNEHLANADRVSGSYPFSQDPENAPARSQQNTPYPPRRPAPEPPSAVSNQNQPLQIEPSKLEISECRLRTQPHFIPRKRVGSGRASASISRIGIREHQGSQDVSKNYGIDLSDVPAFVAA